MPMTEGKAARSRAPLQPLACQAISPTFAEGNKGSPLGTLTGADFHN